MHSQNASRLWIGSLISAGLLLVLAGGPADAQSLFGTISGQVVDEQGGALPGANVILTDQTSRSVQHTVTNAEGLFVFAAVPAGTFSVKVEMQGFNSWEATDIGLRLGERRTITGIRLRVGGLAETVSVTARPEIAPLDSGEKSARLTSEQIQNVPMVGRSAAELLKLLPGMTPISMYPQMWQASGLPYDQLIDELVRLAIERHARRASKRHTARTPRHP